MTYPNQIMSKQLFWMKKSPLLKHNLLEKHFFPHSKMFFHTSLYSHWSGVKKNEGLAFRNFFFLLDIASGQVWHRVFPRPVSLSGCSPHWGPSLGLGWHQVTFVPPWAAHDAYMYTYTVTRCTSAGPGSSRPIAPRQGCEASHSSSSRGNMQHRALATSTAWAAQRRKLGSFIDFPSWLGTFFVRVDYGRNYYRNDLYYIQYNNSNNIHQKGRLLKV